MSWIEWLQLLWPIAVILIPIIIATGLLWLKTQLATKVELGALDSKLSTKIEDHVSRFERGSAKFADHDRRIALVEEECASNPTRNDLNQGLAVVAGRMSGVEASVRGLERTMDTQHQYIRTLLESEIKGAGK